jgi:hypothetical protein
MIQQEDAVFAMSRDRLCPRSQPAGVGFRIRRCGAETYHFWQGQKNGNY